VSHPNKDTHARYHFDLAADVSATQAHLRECESCRNVIDRLAGKEEDLLGGGMSEELPPTDRANGALLIANPVTLFAATVIATTVTSIWAQASLHAPLVAGVAVMMVWLYVTVTRFEIVWMHFDTRLREALNSVDDDAPSFLEGYRLATAETLREQVGTVRNVLLTSLAAIGIAVAWFLLVYGTAPERIARAVLHSSSTVVAAAFAGVALTVGGAAVIRFVKMMKKTRNALLAAISKAVPTQA